MQQITTSTSFAVSPVERTREPLPVEPCRDAIQGFLGREIEAADYRGQLVASIRSHPLIATLPVGEENPEPLPPEPFSDTRYL